MRRFANWETCDENSDCGSNVCLNQTCRPTSALCGDGHCEIDRAESWQDCSADCKIIDCDSNADCASGYFCDFRAGDDPCMKIEYFDKCANHEQWFCQEGDVYFCGEKDGYYQPLLKKTCRLDKVCDGSTVGSAHDCGSSRIELQIEDATPGVKVFKQVGDKASIYIYSKTDQAVQMDYSNYLALDEGICNKGSIYLSKNATKCVFSINMNATGSSLWIRAGSKEKFIDIIDNPKLLIITEREKLFFRFNDINGVKSLLAKAYEKAALEHGIVYDLGMELSGHPFNDLRSYKEDILNPLMTDNTYSLAVFFFKQKTAYEI